MASKNNYSTNIIRARRGRKKSIPKATTFNYSVSDAGYQAWLADGHKGSFEAFLESQARIHNKEYIIEQILAELSEMSVTELGRILENLRDRNFVGI